MSYDFSGAKPQGGGGLIPKNTLCPVHLTLRPGGHGDGGWLKRTKAGNALMLDCEFTVIDGEYAKRKFWGYFTVEGETEGQLKAVDITRSLLRAVLESARGVKPSDASPGAQEKRKVNNWNDFDGLRFWAVVGVEESKDAQYADKNKLSAVVTPDRKEWTQIPQGGSAPPPSPNSSKPSNGTTGRPSWAA